MDIKKEFTDKTGIDANYMLIQILDLFYPHEEDLSTTTISQLYIIGSKLERLGVITITRDRITMERKAP